MTALKTVGVRTALVAGVAALAYILFFTSSASAMEGTDLTAELSGANEVPALEHEGTGEMHLFVGVGNDEVCYNLSYQGIATPTAAHIHEGAAGVNGGVAVGLFGGDVPFADSGCVAAETSTVNNILAYPEEYYINVHNAEYPAGVIRGQLELELELPDAPETPDGPNGDEEQEESEDGSEEEGGNEEEQEGTEEDEGDQTPVDEEEEETTEDSDEEQSEEEGDEGDSNEEDMTEEDAEDGMEEEEGTEDGDEEESNDDQEEQEETVEEELDNTDGGAGEEAESGMGSDRGARYNQHIAEYNQRVLDRINQIFDRYGITFSPRATR